MKKSDLLAIVFFVLIAGWLYQSYSRKQKAFMAPAPEKIAEFKSAKKLPKAKPSKRALNSVLDIEQAPTQFSLTFLNSKHAREPKQTMIFSLKAKLRKIRFSELLSFLEKQRGHQKDYILDTHDCKHFAQELYENALAQNIAAYFVAIDLAHSKIGHAVAAFDTLDQGMVYVDFTPTRVNGEVRKKKRIVWLEQGKNYFDIEIDKLPMGFENKFSDYYRKHKQQKNLKQDGKQLKRDVEEFNNAVADFQIQLRDYNARVNAINARGGASSPAEVVSLNTEKAELDAQKIEIEEWQAELQAIEEDIIDEQEELGFASSDWIVKSFQVFPKQKHATIN